MIMRVWAAFAAVVLVTSNFFTANVLAGEMVLDAATVERFVKSMPDVQAHADKMEAEGRTEIFDKTQNPMVSGEFTPYSSGLKVLKSDAPRDHKALAKILKAHGFTTDEWAVTGDRVLAAYVAIEMGNNPEFAGLAQMDPSMLEAMPPQAKAQFAGVMKTMEKIKNVPEADKMAVQPNVAALELFMTNDRQ